MKKQKYDYLLVVTLVVLGFLIVVPAFAQTNPGFNRGAGRGQGQMPAVVGKVLTNDGSTLTVSGRQGFNNSKSGTTAAATTFTVNTTSSTKVTKNNAAGTVAGIAVGDTVMVQGTVSGTTVTATNIRDGVVMMAAGARGIAGKVSAINGTSLTVTTQARPNGGTATTYTVDASNATVTKNFSASSVSNITVGDAVVVQGTVNGTTITAKTISDGVVPQGQPAIQGNGQPVVAGNVTVINGNTITITNKSNVTYTVDASGAKFVVSGTTSPTISNIAVGDSLTIQGTVNGNSVTASSVIDQKAKPASGNSQKSGSNFMGGMMNGIGSFFKHLFGF